jgi:hypothetical protein
VGVEALAMKASGTARTKKDRPRGIKAPRKVPVTRETRKLMERELALYMAALGVDAQYAVRKCAFLIRCLSLPVKLTARDALRDLEFKLGVTRERAQLGRPWGFRQLELAYWARQKRFIRRAPMPMTPEEWASFVPYAKPKELTAAHATWVKVRRKRKELMKGKTRTDRYEEAKARWEKRRKKKPLSFGRR